MPPSLQIGAAPSRVERKGGRWKRYTGPYLQAQDRVIQMLSLEMYLKRICLYFGGDFPGLSGPPSLSRTLHSTHCCIAEPRVCSLSEWRGLGVRREIRLTTVSLPWPRA